MEAIYQYGLVGSGSSGLWAGDEPRVVTHYPSGLVRVSQTYYSRTDDAASSRLTLAPGNPMPDGNSDPAIDGLYIFPASQESQSGSVIQFSVTAYGRTTTTPPAPVNLPQRLSIVPLNFSVWQASGSIVVPYNSIVSPADLGIVFDDTFLTPFEIVRINSSTQSLLSIEETTITEPTARFQPMPTIVLEAASLTLLEYLLPIPGIRQYTVKMTNDGITQAGTDLFISLKDPEIRYTSFRNFGKFMEVDFETVRTPYTTA